MRLPRTIRTARKKNSAQKRLLPAAYLERIDALPHRVAEFQGDLTPVDLRYLGLPK
jgi:hypothetical protein